MWGQRKRERVQANISWTLPDASGMADIYGDDINMLYNLSLPFKESGNPAASQFSFQRPMLPPPV